MKGAGISRQQTQCPIQNRYLENKRENTVIREIITGRLGGYPEKQPGLVNGQQKGKSERTRKNLVAARIAYGVKQELE